jgi:O-antigen/teichoic acid export membrane protein
MDVPNFTRKTSTEGTMDNGGRKIALNTVLLSATEFFTRLISLVLIILVARLLGPVMLGIYAFALGLLRVCDIFLNFGMDRYLQREVGRQPDWAGPLFSRVFALKSLVYLFILVVIFSLSFTIIEEPLKRWVLLVLTVALFFRTHTASATALFRARQKAKYEATVIITMRLLYGGAGLAAILSGQGLLTLVFLELGAQIIAFLAAVWLFWHRIASPWHPVAWTGLKQLVAATKDFFFIRLVLTLSSSLNILLLSFLVGDLATGFYAAALRLTSAFDFLPEAFSGAFLPVISRQVRENWQGFVLVFQNYFKYLIIVGIGLTASLSSLAPQLIPFVFGSAFQQAVPVLTFLALGLTLEFINLSLTNALIALNAEGKILRNFTAVLFFNLLASLLLIPVFQEQGAAWAFVLAESLVLVLQLRALGHNRLRHLTLGTVMWRPLLAGLLTFGWGCFLAKTQIPLPAALALTGLGFLLSLFATGALSLYELKTLKTWAMESKHAV